MVIFRPSWIYGPQNHPIDDSYVRNGKIAISGAKFQKMKKGSIDLTKFQNFMMKFTTFAHSSTTETFGGCTYLRPPDDLTGETVTVTVKSCCTFDTMPQNYANKGQSFIIITFNENTKTQMEHFSGILGIHGTNAIGIAAAETEISNINSSDFNLDSHAAISMGSTKTTRANATFLNIINNTIKAFGAILFGDEPLGHTNLKKTNFVKNVDALNARSTFFNSFGQSSIADCNFIKNQISHMITTNKNQPLIVSNCYSDGDYFPESDLNTGDIIFEGVNTVDKNLNTIRMRQLTWDQCEKTFFVSYFISKSVLLTLLPILKTTKIKNSI